MKAIAFLLTLVAGALLVFVSQGPCVEPPCRDLVETVSSYGYINWSKGMVLAKETSVATPPSLQERGNESVVAPNDCVPQGSLFQVVRKVRINATTFVGDLLEDNDMIRIQLLGMVERAELVKREYVSNGTVETTVAVDIPGGLAQLALPQDIKPVPEIKTFPNEEGDQKETRPPGAPAPHTGLVFDARGLKGVPAMAPGITNENGEEIYGAAYVSREFAVQYGMATFETDLDTGKANPRVKGNPLVVTCLKVRGEMPCNFIISNADASRILSASENLLLLKKCKVVIVLD